MCCKKCGTELKEGQKFCPKCGNEIKLSQNAVSENKTRKPIIIVVAVSTIAVLSVFLIIMCFNHNTPYEKFIIDNADNIQELQNVTYSIDGEKGYNYSIDSKQVYLLSAYETDDERLITLSADLDQRNLIIDLYTLQDKQYVLTDTNTMENYCFPISNMNSNIEFGKINSGEFVFINQYKDLSDSEWCHSDVISLTIDDKITIENNLRYSCKIDDFGNKRQAAECKKWTIEDKLSGKSAATYNTNSSGDYIQNDAEYNQKQAIINSITVNEVPGCVLCSNDIRDFESDQNIQVISYGTILSDKSDGQLSFTDYTGLLDIMNELNK